jgi:formylglycine-generating enzyme required for sulfatase activity
MSIMEKKICLLALTLGFASLPLFAADSTSFQKCMVYKSTGTVQVWLKDKTRWMKPEEVVQCKQGHTVETQGQSRLVVTLEPSMTGTIEENSVVSFDKMLINRTKKSIRMLIRQQKGTFSIKMEPLFAYTALLTMNTPSATVDMNGAEALVRVNKDTTIVELMSGSAKVRQNGSTSKSVLHSGTRAVIAPNNPDIVISALSEEKKSGSLQKDMKVAILSIQSSTVARDNLERVSDFIAEEMEKKSSTKVLYLEDIRAMLQSEGLEQLLTCYTDSCISQIGSAIGVDAVIVGGLGQLGSNYLFTIKMIDVLRNNLLNRESVRITGDISKILDEIPSMVGKMVKQAATKTAAVPSVAAAPADAAVPAQGGSDSIQYREMVTWLKGGQFVMGKKASEGEMDESPPHNVAIRSLYFDRYEVTKQEFEKVMGYNPSTVKGCEECPVDNITWLEADQYCGKLGKRLPTEAEWEYACRAGTSTQFSFGNTLTAEQANFNGRFPFGGVPAGQYRERAVPVGSYKPNAWNLYDMHGNVVEWCYDWYDPAYYGNSAEADPQGPKDGKLKVVRGGAFNQKGSSLRSAKRAGYNPLIKLNAIGFRCVKDDTAKAPPDTAR